MPLVLYTQVMSILYPGIQPRHTQHQVHVQVHLEFLSSAGESHSGLFLAHQLTFQSSYCIYLRLDIKCCCCINRWKANGKFKNKLKLYFSMKKSLQCIPYTVYGPYTVYDIPYTIYDIPYTVYDILYGPYYGPYILLAI